MENKMKKVMISLMLGVCLASSLMAASKGSIYDPLYVVAMSTTSTVTGLTYLQDDVYFGTNLNISTMAAVGTLDVVHGIKTSTINATAEFNAGTSTVLGALYVGTQLHNNEVSTIAANGAITAVSISIVGAASVTNNITASADIAVTAKITASSAAISGVVSAGTTTILGALYIGNQVSANQISTVTAAGAITAPSLTGVTSIGVPTTGMVIAGLRTIAQLMAATAVAGEIGICSNCTPVEIFISTGAGAPNTGGYGNAAGAQLD